MKTIQMAKIIDEALPPTRKHSEDAGIDFYSCEEKCIPPHSFSTVRTGITIELKQGFVALLFPKSRSNFLLGAGVVDAGYQGEIKVKVLNPTDEEIIIDQGQAIAQMVILPIETPSVEMVSLDEVHPDVSARGVTGGINL